MLKFIGKAPARSQPRRGSLKGGLLQTTEETILFPTSSQSIGGL